MIESIHKQQSSIPYKILCGFIALTFLTSVILPPSYAQSVLNLPVPGTMVPPSSGFAPALMTGITIHPDNPLRFDFIMDRGQSDLSDEPLKEEYTKIIKYFMASLTVPEDELWVNLSPYEKDRMVAEGLGKTEMGRDMLAQDYLLKQLTASLMYPEKELGKKFWDKIYKQAREKYGTTEIPVNTFNKVWIVPDQALVYEQGTSAFVIKSRLAVMLEQDYVAMQHNPAETPAALFSEGKQQGLEVAGDVVTTGIIREIIIPEIEKEINEGENFANLRQIYNALILATWYKQRLKDSLLGKVYVDQNKTKGIDTEDKEVNQKIYDQYIESFKKGVYNFIKEDLDPATQEIIPRKYFSGGARLTSHPRKGDLKLRSLQTLVLGTVLAFGVSSFSARDVSAAVTGTRDGVTTEFVDNGEDGNIGTAIVVTPGVEPLLLAQALYKPEGIFTGQADVGGASGSESLVEIPSGTEELMRYLGQGPELYLFNRAVDELVKKGDTRTPDFLKKIYKDIIARIPAGTAVRVTAKESTVELELKSVKIVSAFAKIGRESDLPFLHEIADGFGPFPTVAQQVIKVLEERFRDEKLDRSKIGKKVALLPGSGTSSSPVEIERAFRENAQELKDADFNDLFKDYPVTGIKRIVDKAREVFSLGLPLADYTKLISELNYRKARTFRFETLGLFLSDDLGTQPRWMIDVLQQKTIPHLLNLSNAIDIFIEKADLIKNKAVKTRVMNRLRAYRELVNDFLESAYQFLDDLVAKYDVDRIAIPWIYYGPHKKLWVDTGETSLRSYVEIRIHAQAHSNGQIVIDIYNDWVSDAGRKVFQSSDPRFQSRIFYTAVKNILNSGGVFSGWEDLSKAVARDSSLIKTDSASSPVTLGQVREAFMGIRNDRKIRNPETVAKFDEVIRIIDDSQRTEKGVTIQQLQEPLYSLYSNLNKDKLSSLIPEIHGYLGSLELGGIGQVSQISNLGIGKLINPSIQELIELKNAAGLNKEEARTLDTFIQNLKRLGTAIGNEALTFGMFHNFVIETGKINSDIINRSAQTKPVLHKNLRGLTLHKLVDAVFELQFGGFSPSPTPPAASSPVEDDEWGDILPQDSFSRLSYPDQPVKIERSVLGDGSALVTYHKDGIRYVFRVEKGTFAAINKAGFEVDRDMEGFKKAILASPQVSEEIKRWVETARPPSAIKIERSSLGDGIALVTYHEDGIRYIFRVREGTFAAFTERGIGVDRDMKDFKEKILASPQVPEEIKEWVKISSPGASSPVEVPSVDTLIERFTENVLLVKWGEYKNVWPQFLNRDKTGSLERLRQDALKHLYLYLNGDLEKSFRALLRAFSKGLQIDSREEKKELEKIIKRVTSMWDFAGLPSMNDPDLIKSVLNEIDVPVKDLSLDEFKIVERYLKGAASLEDTTKDFSQANKTYLQKETVRAFMIALWITIRHDIKRSDFSKLMNLIKEMLYAPYREDFEHPWIKGADTSERKILMARIIRDINLLRNKSISAKIMKYLMDESIPIYRNGKAENPGYKEAEQDITIVRAIINFRIEQIEKELKIERGEEWPHEVVGVLYRVTNEVGFLDGKDQEMGSGYPLDTAIIKELYSSSSPVTSGSSPIELEAVIDAFEIADHDAALQHLEQLIVDAKQPEILVKLSEAKEKIGQIKTLARRVASQKESIPEAVSEKIKFEEARLERLQEMAADSAGREVTLGRLRMSIDKVESSIRDMARQAPKAKVYLKSKGLLAKYRSWILSSLRELKTDLENVVTVEAPEEIRDLSVPVIETVRPSVEPAGVGPETFVEPPAPVTMETFAAAKENFWKSRNLEEAGAALKDLRVKHLRPRALTTHDLLQAIGLQSQTMFSNYFDKGKMLVYQRKQTKGDVVYQIGDVNPAAIKLARELGLIDSDHSEESFAAFLRKLAQIEYVAAPEPKAEPKDLPAAPETAREDFLEVPTYVTTWEDLIGFWEFARSKLLDSGLMYILGSKFNGNNGQQKLGNYKKDPAKYLSVISEEDAKRWGELVNIDGDEMWAAVQRIMEIEKVKKREAKYRPQDEEFPSAVPPETDVPLTATSEQSGTKDALWDQIVGKVKEEALKTREQKTLLRKAEDAPFLRSIPREIKDFGSFGRFIKERMEELNKSRALVAAEVGVSRTMLDQFYFKGIHLVSKSKKESNVKHLRNAMRRLAYSLRVEEDVFLQKLQELDVKEKAQSAVKTVVPVPVKHVEEQPAEIAVVTPEPVIAVAEPVNEPVSEKIIQDLFDLAKEEPSMKGGTQIEGILRELLENDPRISKGQIDLALKRVMVMLRNSRKVFVPAGATAINLATDTPAPVALQAEKPTRRPPAGLGESDVLSEKISKLNEKDAAIVTKFIEGMKKLGFEEDEIFNAKFKDINRRYNGLPSAKHRNLFEVYGEVMRLLTHPVIIGLKNGAKSSSPVAEPPGGIDLNPALLDLQIKRDNSGVPLPLPLQPVETMHIDGFLPVIINITPVSNLPMLLGLADTQPDTEEARPSFKAREIESVSLLN